MASFLDALRSGRLLLMDGAMGTELQRLGLSPNECGEKWNVSNAATVRAIHDRYVAAGAQVLLTNTFQAHPAHLARFGMADLLEEINGAAVRLARQAAGPSRFVLGDVGPILDPKGKDEFADFDQLERMLHSLDGVDGLLFETCSSPRSLSAVQFAFHRVVEVETPLLLSLTYRRSSSGQLVTRSGHGPETFARHAERSGVAALGVNCGRDIGMDEIITILQRYRSETDLPLFARPNAGTPTQQGDRCTYPLTPESMASRLPELREAGAGMIGGCCGTTPEYVEAFRGVANNQKFIRA